MRTIFYYDMYAGHDVIIESACVWLEDVNSNSKKIGRRCHTQQGVCEMGFLTWAALAAAVVAAAVHGKILLRPLLAFILSSRTRQMQFETPDCPCHTLPSTTSAQ